MSRMIYVVYKLNNHAPPTGLKAFAWESQARDYAFKRRHEFPSSLGIMIVEFEGFAEEG